VYIQPRQGDADFDNAFGARVTWDAPGCMRASAHGVYATFDISDTLSDAERDAVIAGGGMPADWDGVVSQSYDDFTITGAAIECATERVTLTAEGTVWRSDVETTPMLAEPFDYLRVKAYAQAEYRVTERVSAAAYLSIYRNQDDDNDPDEDRYHQHDAALAARVDITPNWLVKAEVHAIDGYGMTEGSLNSDRERASHWGMFLAKTTLSF
jgi:hypothetical protein